MIILFDGVCYLCNGAVQFIIGRDPLDRFQFASLQSGIGQDFVERYGLGEIDSIILIKDDRAFIKSSAVLHIAFYLSGLWKIGFLGLIIPRVIRDFIYEKVAMHRYDWFGKSDKCMVPSPEMSGRFLDS